MGNFVRKTKVRNGMSKSKVILETWAQEEEDYSTD